MRARAIVVWLGLGLALAGAAATSAAADGTSLEGLLGTAETAEKNARASRDPDAFEVCGQAYLEASRVAEAEAPDVVPTALYNAAVCFEEARSFTTALAIYARLEKVHAKDRLAQHAVARRAHIYLGIGWYAEAARDLETYAAKWPTEREASDALENAMRLRAALGDEAAARKDAERWIALYGARRPREAGDAALWLAWRARERGDVDAAVRAYRDWLRRFGGRAERDQLAGAYLALGRLRWDASCKAKGAARGGLCLGAPPRATGARCGDPPPVAVARDASLAKEATASLQQALRVADASGDERARLLADQARLLLADAKLEAAIARDVPRLDIAGPGGDLTPASRKALATWMQTWQADLAGARRGYEELLRSRNLRVAVEAAGRIAWLTQHAADTLASAPLPPWKKPKLEDLRAPYCGALRDVAAPLAAHAKEAAAACLGLAAQVGVADETRLCVAVHDRHAPIAAAAGERLPPAASPRVVDVEPEVRYWPPGLPRPVTPSPP